MNTIWYSVQIVVDVVGAAALLFAIFVAFNGVIDSFRYMRLSRM
jgi:hypothetical protein